MLKPLLSIVTGTFQRLDYLRAMVLSVRQQLPPNFPYEVIVVDGGSTDGTQAWCKQQPDVRLLEHGELRGALKAFGDGARAARGEMVLLANDDVLFHSGSIVAALNHLFAHPQCGAVAFEDNRPAPGKASGYGVQYVPAFYPNGRTTSVPYAQVGLFRQWLGESIGWWGDQHPVMSENLTYGGDNFLSAGIWSDGYTVDVVAGARVDDRIPQDSLRERNSSHDSKHVSPYHRLYPNGVPLPSELAPPPPDALRILYLPLFSPGYGRYKTGLYDALAKHGTVYELDYHQHRAHLATAVNAFQPHLVLSQFHDTNAVDASVLERLRELAPGAVWVNWVGDYYPQNMTSDAMVSLLRHVDLQLVVNAEVLPFYEAQAIPAAFWQIGWEPVPEELPEAPAHKLLFQGNAYRHERLALGAALRQLDPNAGLYGNSWEPVGGSGKTLYDFAFGAALYQNCQIAIGDNMYPGGKAFVSNRFVEALAHGAFLLHQHVDELELHMGVIEGVHYVEWADLADLREKVAYYLAHEQERRKIAEAGQAFIQEHFSFDAQVRKLFEELLPRLAHGTHDDAAPVDDLAYMEHMAGWKDGIPR